jgi:iron-sulfur cluster repair protein YtfE (RIC family)
MRELIPRVSVAFDPTEPDAVRSPTASLREEHRELLPHLEHLRIVADAVGDLNDAALLVQVADASEFLTRHLIPHARAEDAALYPVVGRLMGSPAATATMSRDHVAVVGLADDLRAASQVLARDGATDAVAHELRRTLYGLYALLKTHFAKEEEIYLPLLDERLTLDEAAEMFAKMEQAAHRAKELAERSS